MYLCRAISLRHARKTGQTNCRLRHQHHRRKVPELPAHALLHPCVRAGDLRRRHRHLCPYPAGAHAADDGHGVELFPFFGQGRGGGRRCEGGQAAAFRHDVGRHVARRGGVLPGDGLFPRRHRPHDGRGVCRASRIRRLGRPDHPFRRLGLHPLLAAARTGPGHDVRGAESHERRSERGAGLRVRRRRAVRHRLRRGMGLRRQPDRQRRDVAGDPRDRRPHRSEDQLGAARRDLRLLAAAAGGRACRYGQRVHRPAADQVPRSRGRHGPAGHLRGHHEDRRGDDALLPDVPPCRRAVLPLELQKVGLRRDERRGAEILRHGLDADFPRHRAFPRRFRADRGA